MRAEGRVAMEKTPLIISSWLCVFFYQMMELEGGIFITGGFFEFLNVLYSTMLHLPPSGSTVSEDAGSNPVVTFALALKRSHHSAKSHPQLGKISSTLG